MADDDTDDTTELSGEGATFVTTLMKLVDREVAQAMAPLEERIAELERRVKALESSF